MKSVWLSLLKQPLSRKQDDPSYLGSSRTNSMTILNMNKRTLWISCSDPCCMLMKNMLLCLAMFAEAWMHPNFNARTARITEALRRKPSIRCHYP